MHGPMNIRSSILCAYTRDQLHNQNKTGNARTLTLRGFRETIVAVEKKYLIF